MRFLRACNDDATLPLMARAADGLRALGATKVAAVGFCWGGRYAALMGAGAAGGADAVVIAHPGVVSAEEYGKLRVPALFLLADPATEMSSNMGPKNLAATRAALAARPAPAPEAAFVEYAGCKHGFASRGCQGDEAVKKACVDAHERAAAFIVKHLA